ncbi:MAG: ATP-binding cassette domain-containing protein [Olsenella sp.]|jgi:macrolide transport system ATP-binding/permease protein
MQLNLSNVHYTYAGSPHEALAGVTVTFPRGWTGVVGDNGCGKSTLARVATGQLSPTSGAVGPRGLVSSYCEQDADLEPEGLSDFACDYGAEAVSLRARLGIDDSWPWRYAELSCGQRKRLQVAVALWRRPDVLVMDEPTNHLDAPTRTRVLDALRACDGVGILISHDRALLDALVDRCLMFEAGGWRMRPGGYSQASGQARADVASAAARQDAARREERRLRAERQRRVEAASRTDALRSRRGLDPRDHDARERIGRAIVSGKDGVAGRLAKSLDARIGEKSADAEAAFVARRYDGRLPGFGSRSRRQVLAHLPAGVVPYGEGAPHGPDGALPGVLVPELHLGSADHVGLVGPNGSGKSTLVRALVAAVPEDVPALYVPQELGPAREGAAVARLRGLPAAERGRVLSVVAQLNSDPDALLAGGSLSPGELRKLVIAEASLDEPQLLVMDEPTNHLDLHSVEALASFLAAFPGALVLVSHDERAVADSCDVTWELVPAGAAGARLAVH